ncbi:MAG: hypothetical protein A3D65_03790 [Candidatus Lloydbacteria bacterium RIFCSPHIGHO2_02_FULL_50_13]|uniref:Uncharacterized protein n=1 Tax=Candidatus Lloydbacteria bacterium RIFCSPHIGHO2_02_FULL_50_13 TaxID=1798661 RepID=A0A1G2D1Z9_9BACT|nr:MAG: hypothetical protein A3D65_03790 [Candidatus Lloydbacteria bacterium RIFCSPHIGHO2_02_FULL_50_13]
MRARASSVIPLLNFPCGFFMLQYYHGMRESVNQNATFNDADIVVVWKSIYERNEKPSSRSRVF